MRALELLSDFATTVYAGFREQRLGFVVLDSSAGYTLEGSRGKYHLSGNVWDPKIRGFVEGYLQSMGIDILPMARQIFDV